MLYRETVAVCSEINTKHINTLCGQNVGLLNFKSARNFVLHVPLLKSVLYFCVQTNKCTSINMFSHIFFCSIMFRPPL
jgi:hypothetical protein